MKTYKQKEREIQEELTKLADLKVATKEKLKEHKRDLEQYKKALKLKKTAIGCCISTKDSIKERELELQDELKKAIEEKRYTAGARFHLLGAKGFETPSDNNLYLLARLDVKGNHTLISVGKGNRWSDEFLFSEENSFSLKDMNAYVTENWDRNLKVVEA